MKAPLPVLACLFSVGLLFGCAKVGENHPGGTTGGGGTTGSGTGGSGGVATTGAGGLPATGGGGAGGATCGLQRFNLVRKQAEVVLVLDRSASMQDNLMDNPPTGPTDPTKWSQVIPALTDVISMAGMDVSWGLKAFFQDGAECGTATVPAGVDVSVSDGDAPAVAAAVNAVTPNGNGTPTGAAVAAASSYLQSLPPDRQKYILLATDGQPSCVGRVGSITKDTTNSRADAIAAVSEAATAGIHTFVVGVATTKDNDVTTLNSLAMAGLEPRPNPNPLATKFYLASTRSELTAALNVIVGAVSTCTFPLSPPPPVPDRIAVKVSGVKAPQDATHTDGWDYTSGDHTAVQVYGSWCDMIKTSAANMVEIVYGCMDIVPT